MREFASEPFGATDDRIAVIGVACRVPGAPDVMSLWRNLCAGVDAVRRFSPAEVAATGVPAGDPSWVPAFGHLDGLTDFDERLFGYGPEDATLLDPQHRIFLEVAWWALEDAGYDPGQTVTQVGVFAGCGANRYLRHHLLGNPAVGAAGWLAEDWDEMLIGGTCDYLPTRAAYAMGLTGPAVAVQTACSSSLVAVCQAAQSLLDFRCDLAIAGGAAVVSTRQAGYRHKLGGTLAVDGICRPFDAAATGQVFGNGGGAVVLKRLRDAVDDGDHVHAVLAGWAITNDGADRAGLTVPGVSGQAAVIAEALAVADWDPADIGFVECHGSGTPVGDAIEVDALTRAFRDSSERTEECVLGSVKSNVGNLDAAAGVLGLIKSVLAVRDGVIPPTLHFREPHPEVDLAGAGFMVGTEAIDWGEPRRAGVSSFGLGGTNAHVLVEQAPIRPASVDGPEWTLLPLSAMDATALRRIAERLAVHLADMPDVSLVDVGYTLSVGRKPLPYKAAIACRDMCDAVAGLAALGRGEHPPAAGAEPPDGQRVPLPGYPFQRTRHWIDPL